MQLNMLRAISKMLEHDPAMNATTFLARVECAQTMLNEIIIGMTPPEKLTPNRGKDIEPVYDIKINPSTKALEYILEGGVPLDDDIEIEVDGKRLRYGSAIGKVFNVVKVI